MRVVQAFVTKQLSAESIPFQRVSSISRRFEERMEARKPPSRHRLQRDGIRQTEEREVDRSRFWLDTAVLSHGFGFLGSLAGVVDEHDRTRLLDYHEAILTVFTGTMPKVQGRHQRVEGTPYDFDLWILRTTAAVVAQLETESEARRFWQPIVDLGPGAHYWIESFFQEWLVTGSRFAPSLDHFARRWGEMIAYALEAPNVTGGWPQSFWLDDCFIEIMGLGLAINIAGAEEFRPVVQVLTPLYERWADKWLSQARFGVQVRLLPKPTWRSCSAPSGVAWLGRGVQTVHAGDEDDLGEALTGALRACWRSCRMEIAGDEPLRKEFLCLLNLLCNHLNADALSLRAEVTQSLSAEER